MTGFYDSQNNTNQSSNPDSSQDLNGFHGKAAKPADVINYVRLAQQAAADSMRYAEESKGYRDESQGYANDAAASALESEAQKDLAIIAKDEAEAARDASQLYSTQSFTYSEQSKGYRDESQVYSQQSQSFSVQSQGYRDEAEGFRDETNADAAYVAQQAAELENALRNAGQFDPNVGYPPPLDQATPYFWYSSDNATVGIVNWTVGDVLSYVPHPTDPDNLAGTYYRIAGELASGGDPVPVEFLDNIILQKGKAIVWKDGADQGEILRLDVNDNVIIGERRPDAVGILRTEDVHIFAEDVYHQREDGGTRWKMVTEEGGVVAREAWVTANFAPIAGGGYVQKAGDTMSGTLVSTVVGRVTNAKSAGNSYHRFANNSDDTRGFVGYVADDVMQVNNQSGNDIALITGGNVNISNPHSSNVQGTNANALTRYDYVDGNFVHLTGNEDISGLKTFTSNEIRISGTSPRLSFIETNSPDEGVNWNIIGDGGNLSIRAKGASETWMSFDYGNNVISTTAQNIAVNATAPVSNNHLTRRDFVTGLTDALDGRLDTIEAHYVTTDTVQDITNHKTFTDGNALRFGSDEDFQMSHNGSDMFISNATGSLNLTASTDEGDILLRTTNGSTVHNVVVAASAGSETYAVLNHNNAQKLRTTINGIQLESGVELGNTSNKLEVINASGTLTIGSNNAFHSHYESSLGSHFFYGGVTVEDNLNANNVYLDASGGSNTNRIVGYSNSIYPRIRFSEASTNADIFIGSSSGTALGSVYLRPRGSEVSTNQAVLSPDGVFDIPTVQVDNQLQIPSESVRTGQQGDIRYNDSLDKFEGHDGTAWGALGGGLPPPTIVAASTACVVGANYLVDNATEVTMTLPSGALAGDLIYIGDYNGNFGINNKCIITSTEKIEAGDSDIELTQANVKLTFQYVNSTVGWKIMDGIGEDSNEAVPTAVGENLLINSDVSVWQRGTTSAAPGGGWGADRWRVAGFTTVYRSEHGEGNASTNNRYVMAFTKNSGSAYIDQCIEDGKFKLTGKTLTFSFIVGFGADPSSVISGIQFINYARNAVYTGSDIEWTSLPPNGWYRGTATMTLPDSGLDEHFYLRIAMDNAPAVTDGMWVSDCKLEYGKVATDFIPDSQQTNIAKCQRYYQAGTCLTQAGNVFVHKSFATVMRQTPSVVVSAGSVANVAVDGFNIQHPDTSSRTYTADAEL